MNRFACCSCRDDDPGEPSARFDGSYWWRFEGVVVLFVFLGIELCYQVGIFPEPFDCFVSFVGHCGCHDLASLFLV